MSSRAAILGALRRHQPPATALPDPLARGPHEGDPVARFVAAVEAIAGDVIAGSADVAIDALIAERYPAAMMIASTVAGMGAASVQLDGIADPHELAALDLLVCEAEFGVAENGAVWLPESRLGHRAAPFLAQHLLVLLDRHSIVWDMHEAYDRMPVDAGGFGAFVAGPSKTADIEQALVIGAHGPRSLTIVLN
jgi:L-lactate dehydrogenase complex protein LldG